MKVRKLINRRFCFMSFVIVIPLLLLLFLCCYCYCFGVIVIPLLSLLFLCCYCYCCCFFLAQIISGFRLRAMAPQPLGRFSAICCSENKIWTNFPAIISSLFQFVSFPKQDLDKICNELYFTLKVTNLSIIT